jgi:hypothetical protein
MQRRLAAILAADVVGYSRLMEGTFSTISAPNGPAGAVRRRPLFGVDRRWPDHGKNGAIDPVSGIGSQRFGPTFPRRPVLKC